MKKELIETAIKAFESKMDELLHGEYTIGYVNKETQIGIFIAVLEAIGKELKIEMRDDRNDVEREIIM